ncbi:hypothetical protein GHT06_015855 [Daphnia sinensis]|uniref:Uncharacterized protein n=1 Tax=Daphnia sinensis TaxID=1820382 RepID=A0AAD5PT83_9CRUS|nr:hypothetical protein GHT06_015855 [Daphnia sinensis]
MDKPGVKRLALPRSRVPSNSSTPSGISRRGTSTPTGSSNKNRSCNYSPITNLDFSKSSAGSTDKSEPKLLKPLGPSFPQSSTEKKSVSKPKLSIEEQSTLLYMTYQQQHFLNNQLEESKESVLADCKKQIEDLWHLIKMKESKVAQIKERMKLEKLRLELTCHVNEIQPVVKQTAGVLDVVTPKVKELAHGLDTYRHQIKLIEINEFKNEDGDELIRSFESNAILCKKIETEKLHEVMKTADVVSEVDRRTSSQIKMMEEVQRMNFQTITRLGQEITLSEGKKDYKKLCDFDICQEPSFVFERTKPAR